MIGVTITYKRSRIPDMSETETKNIMENEFDIGQAIRLILMQSKIIILIAFLGTSIGAYFYISEDRIYKINSLVQAYTPQSSNITSELFSSMAINNSTDVESYKKIYKSRTNLLDVVKNNTLNITLEDEDKSISKYIKIFEVPSVLEGDIFYLNLEGQGYELLDANRDIILTDSYNKLSAGENNILILEPNEKPNKTIKIAYLSPEIMFNFLKAQITLTSSEQRYYISRGSELFEVSYLTNDPQKGLDVLNYANNLFIKNNIKAESEEARKALSFIDLNIEKVRKELELDKENLKRFQETNKSVNVDLEIKSIIDNISNIESQISNIDIELAKASNSFTQTNPIYIELIQQKEELVKQKGLIEERIKSLPLAQQEYIDLSSEVEMNQEVYSQLINKQLEFSIREASTLGNIRIIDEAYVVDKVSPRLSSVIIYGLLSMILGCFVAILRGYFYLPISNPAELADRNINVNILGVIPHLESEYDDLDNADQERYDQSIQSLVINIENKLLTKKIDRKTRKILITSATAKNGKSYISRNLALKLSSIGNKVLLIDGDWKRGDLHKDFEKNKLSVEEYKSIGLHNLESFKVNDNLYFIPRVSGLNDSFTYMYSNEFNNSFAEIEESFDYIIYDTAPLLSVSDTAVMMSQSDINICIVRHGVTKINELKQIMAIGDQLGQSFDSIIYNAYKKPSSYYGYYGIYGNYAYQYYAKKYLYNTYGYKKDE